MEIATDKNIISIQVRAKEKTIFYIMTLLKMIDDIEKIKTVTDFINNNFK